MVTKGLNDGLEEIHGIFSSLLPGDKKNFCNNFN